MDFPADRILADRLVEQLPLGSGAVLIAVPFYKNEQLVAPMVAALVACAADIAAIGGEVVFYNDSPDYPELAAALAEALPAAAACFPCRVDTNPENLGFVRTMNLAVAQAVARRADLLMLNSDATPEPGAFTAMARVMAREHMIGFVNPRSNNATIATLPLHDLDVADRRAAFRALAARLPEASYAPTAIGFCMLIRWAVLAEFGGFDEIYGQGYNEENDLVMRAGRCGYRTLFANHAFVWHEGEQSFATSDIKRDSWERTNRAILDQRYPEYGSHTAAHYGAPETVAERLLAALQPDAAGKLDIAFDFSSFRADHNGTFQAGRQLLAAALTQWADRANISVLCSTDVYDFHDYAALNVTRAEPHGGRIFAAVFRVGQPYDWNVLQRLLMSTPVLGVYMLDTISVDCPQLMYPLLYNIWQFTLEHSDLIVSLSRQTEDQLAARFVMPDHVLRVVSYLSLDVADYGLPMPQAAAALPPSARPRLLVLGNHFHHKYLSPTANALAAAFPDRDIVALGAPKPGRPQTAMDIPRLDDAPNLIKVPVGDLPETAIGAEYAACDAVIFPSLAEGFGLPSLHALAAGKPVFLRRLPVFEEIWETQGRTPNFHFYDSTSELIEKLRELPHWVPQSLPPAGNGASRSASEIWDALNRAMQRADYARIVTRIRALQLISDLSNTGAQPTVIDNDAARAARFLAIKVENAARWLLTSRLVYALTRLLFRAQRRVRITVRGG